MVFEIVCGACGGALYSGYDLKAAKDVLRASGGRCKKCSATLSTHDFTVDVSRMG